MYNEKDLYQEQEEKLNMLSNRLDGMQYTPDRFYNRRIRELTEIVENSLEINKFMIIKMRELIYGKETNE
jgi:hypothetical protein